MTRFFALLLLLVLRSSTVVAQMQSADNCELLVHVRGDDGRAIQTPLQVQLLGTQGVISSVQIVGEEVARFRIMNGKTYRLTVSGLGIESVTTSYFEVNALETEHTEAVQVKFTKEKDAEQSNSGSTISVSDLKVPKRAGIDLKKGMEAYSRGKLDVATAHFEKAIAEYPQYARAYDMLGVIAIKNSDRSKARTSFSKSMEVDSTFLPAYVDLARMDNEDQNYSASESLLAKAIAINASDADAVSLLAATEFANKEYDKGLADVQRTHALRNHEQFAEVHLMAGKVLAMQNHPESAIAQFRMFLLEKPGSPQAASVRKALASLTAKR